MITARWTETTSNLLNFKGFDLRWLGYLIRHWCIGWEKCKICNYPARRLRVLGLLVADSALTVGRGKKFWCICWFFFTKGHNSEKKSQKLSLTLEINSLSEGYKSDVDQNWGLIAKVGFLGLFQNKNQSLKEILGVFLGWNVFFVKSLLGQT